MHAQELEEAETLLATWLAPGRSEVSPEARSMHCQAKGFGWSTWLAVNRAEYLKPEVPRPSQVAESLAWLTAQPLALTPGQKKRPWDAKDTGCQTLCLIGFHGAQESDGAQDGHPGKPEGLSAQPCSVLCGLHGNSSRGQCNATCRMNGTLFKV